VQAAKMFITHNISYRMGNRMAEKVPQFPKKLKEMLVKLPAPEAVEIMDEIHKVAWVVDNNNNNKASMIQDLIDERVSKLSSQQLVEILGPKK
jgi:hypothetical protein